MKLIIEIPEEMYEDIKEFDGKHDVLINRKELYNSIKNGILLDDIKVEIEKQIERDFIYAQTEVFKVPCHLGTANGLQVAIRIINDMCKTESEGEE